MQKNEGYAQQWFLMPIEYNDHQLPEITKEKNEVGPNGNLVYSASNVFDNENGLELDLIFDSNGYSDGYSRMGMLRHSFSATMDENPSYEQMRWKAGTRTNPSDACIQTWPTLSLKAYHGALSDSIASYNADTQMCEIFIAGKLTLQLPIFRGTPLPLTMDQYNQKPYHMVTRGDGTTYIFLRNPLNGNYISATNDVVTLERIGDSWEFTDSQDQTDTFDLSGKLIKVANAGETTRFIYDTTDRLLSVTDDFDNKITFGYIGDYYDVNTDPHKTRITSITDSSTGRALNLKYAPTQDIQPSSYDVSNKIREIWQQDEHGNKITTSFSLGITTLPDSITNYDENGASTIDNISYDSNQNVSEISKPDQTTTFRYTPSRLTTVTSDPTTTITTTVDFVILNSVQKPTTLHTTDATLATYHDKTLTYDSDGHLLSIESSEGNFGSSKAILRNKTKTKSSESISITFGFNNRHQLENAHFKDQNGGKSFRYSYGRNDNRPNKIQKENEISFFSYDKEGRVVETINAYLKHPPRDKSEFDNINRDQLLAQENVKQNTYVYNSKGRIASVTDNNGNTTQFEYDDQGNHSVTIRANGKRIVKPANVNGNGNRSKMNARAAWAKSTWINTRAANNQTAFIGGAGDDWISNIVKDYHKLFSSFDIANAVTVLEVNPDLTPKTPDITRTLSQYFSYEDVGNFLGVGSSKPIPKLKDVQTVIGHSWGGDSAVEASKARSSDFDLLVTIDPVGVLDWNDGSNYWISVHANPGPQFTWTKKCWGKKWWKVCVPVKVKANWSSGDYVAWLGGKGWYSTLDKGNAKSDVQIDYSGHHEDFERMIDKMESDILYRYGLSF